ncbi:MAG: peroxidase-related enzyme [Candidatus Heimdallarchaeota archaeon]|nr:peroxidase-related enzyme [Candidatus Heimdallarchaeota archaeon]
MSKAFITVIEPQDENQTNLLKRAYKRIAGTRGRVANVLQIQSLHPKALMDHLDLYMTLMYEESPLTRIQRELIAAYTSYLNNCEYCIIHHYEALLFNWKNAPSMEELATGKDLSKQDKEMIKFVRKLTKEPWKLKEDHINRLREVGFNDRSILDITSISSYFNFVNRLVLGLGVQIENEKERKYNY